MGGCAHTLDSGDRQVKASIGWSFGRPLCNETAMRAVTLRTTIDGHDICCWIRRGSERGILLLHGLGCSKESFEPAFERGALPEELTLIAPDLLGHGESSQPADAPYSLEAHGELVVRLV